MTTPSSWSFDFKSYFKIPQVFIQNEPLDPRTKALQLEEKTLALSGLRPHRDIEIFDVPIKYKGSHFLHTIKCGDKNKEVLVLIHGYMGALVLFYPILKELSKRFKVFCVDLLGLGLSSRPDFPCTSNEETLNYFVDSLEQWRKTLNLKRFHIGGHSFGAYISAQYALKYANRVESLYLLSPTGATAKQEEEAPPEWAAKMSWTKRQFWQMYFKTYSRYFFKARLTAPEFVRKYPRMGKMMIRGYIQMIYGTNFEHAELVSNYLFEMFMIPGGSEKAIHHVLKPPRLGAHIPLEGLISKNLKLPIYCYFGVEDWVDWTGVFKLSQEGKYKHFKFFFVSNCGHQLIMQNPKEIGEAMVTTPIMKRKMK